MNRLGFESHPAATVSEAKELILTEGAGFYDCVLTDYRMPDGNGLELLVWIRERDRTLATIILTGEGDKEVVEMTLKKGASAYLEKPASLATLKEALGRAVAETSERRHLAEAQRQADKVGEALHDLLGIAELKALPHLEISYHPHSRAGGDSLSRILLPDERELLLLADVSGHDLSAAYVSAYFQGLVRGLTEKGDHIREVSDFVNNFLLNEWSRKFRNDSGSVVQTSIAVCGIDIDRTSQKVGIMNCGSPVPLLSDSEGSVVELGTGSPPLGWYNELDTEWIRHAFDEGSQLLLWSDGLEDCALECGVAPSAMAYRFLYDNDADLAEEIIPHAKDDVIVVRLDLSTNPGITSGFHPIIHSTIPGCDHERIDQLQAYWKESLIFSLPNYSDSVLDDVLLCSREAVLNALVHSCEGRPDKECRFRVTYCPDNLTLSVRIDDPGEGYGDTFLLSDAELEDDALMRHCGLILIREIPDKVTTERNGATIILDFDFVGHCEKIRSTFCA